MKSSAIRSQCPISRALDIFGDKWTLLIIRDIIFEHKSSYNDFLESEEKISTNILADRLNVLEAHDFILKKKKPGSKSKHIYIPTEKTISLTPLLTELILWSNIYFPETYTRPPSLLTDLKRNKTKTVKSFIEAVRTYLKNSKG